MNGYDLEDIKHILLPMLKKEVAFQVPDDLDQLIRVKVALMQPILQFDDALAEIVVAHLRTNFNSASARPVILRDRNGHEDWLEIKKPSIEWTRWKRYEYYLRTEKGWFEPVIESLDGTSDQVLDLLADPSVEGRSFERKGLVMGYVQSGKTAHFTALINKALDAQFKVIIVLAGLHNNLRSQTQVRLDEEIMGYTMKRGESESLWVGVGAMESYQFPGVLSLTNSDNDGDFSQKRAGTSFTPPILLVVKKNKTILTNLRNYWRKKCTYAQNVEGVPHKMITDLPLLIIDDEADQASVNTVDVYDDDGYVNPEHEPAVINGLIREIFQTFSQRAYVGYTATPFANMLIDKEAYTERHQQDLFPRDFIVALPKPSIYRGPAEYFDLYDDPDNQQAGLVRLFNQDEGFIPVGHKKDHLPSKLPDDLIQSIYAFIVATAIRRLRGQKNKHSSMLVHVTRFTDVQNRVYRMITEQVQVIKDALRHGKGAIEHDLALRKVWEEDFVPTSASRKDGGPTYDWQKTRAEIAEAIQKLQVKQINGKSSDALDYEVHKKTGLFVLAVGGDKLSRGLTIDGLTVSYYLRTSDKYDTLMQMGRWFGYREGYFDLCRIYTTEALANWFYQIAVATEDVQAQLVSMAEENITPEEYVLRIATHPDLKITSANKMRAAQEVTVSYSASLVQTTVFENKKEFFRQNFQATERFLGLLGGAETALAGDRNASLSASDPEVRGKDGYYFWQDVSSTTVLGFLDRYKTEASLGRVDSNAWGDYIRNRNADRELTNWTVILVSSGDTSERVIGGLSVKPVRRVGDPNNYSASDPRLSIRILTSEGQEFLDYEDAQLKQVMALLEQRNEQANRKKEKASLYAQARKLRSNKNGLLLLYPLGCSDGVLERATADLQLTAMEQPIGVAISFPHSDRARGERSVVINKSVEGG